MKRSKVYENKDSKYHTCSCYIIYNNDIVWRLWYEKYDIRIGTAGEGGMYYSFGREFSNKISSEENLKVKVKETAGSAANLRLLSKNYIELGIAQADLIDDAYNGTGEFIDSTYKGYSAIAGLYTEACQIVVMNDSDILSIDDLQGRKVSIGEYESGTERNAKQILQAYGYNDTLVEMKNYDYKTAVNKLENGEIDALFCTAGIKTEIIDELAGRSKIRLLSIDDNQMEKLHQHMISLWNIIYLLILMRVRLRIYRLLV